MVEKPSQTYPIAIVEDRYTGAYSNGRINFVLSEGPHGSDREAAEFWAASPDWIAVGNSPQEALDRLLQQFKDARAPQ